MNFMGEYCGHCGLIHAGPCPRVKAIEYYPDGTVKRVEYHSQAAVDVVGTQQLQSEGGK